MQSVTNNLSYSALLKRNSILEAELLECRDRLESYRIKYNQLKKSYIQLIRKSLLNQIKLKQLTQPPSSPLLKQFDNNQAEEDIILDDSTQQQQTQTQSIPKPRQSLQRQPTRLFELFAVLSPHSPPRYTYPASIPSHLKSSINILTSFVFCGSTTTYEKPKDKNEDSNLLENGQELVFTLQSGEGQKPSPADLIMQKINPTGKIFCYVYVKHSPVDQQTRQNTAFAFLSRLSFREFFFSLHKSLQDLPKFVKAKTGDLKTYEHLSELLSGCYHVRVSSFPVSYKPAGLYIENDESLYESDIRHTNARLSRYQSSFLSELFMRILLEYHILLVSSSRKSLNEMFQAIRVILKPLEWPFPIIYALNQQLRPLLESPVPLLLGAKMSFSDLISAGYVPQGENWIAVDLDTMKIYRNIDQQLIKLDESDYISQGLCRILDKQSKALRTRCLSGYLLNKLHTASTGATQYQLTDFDLRFMGTQMVAQYLNATQH